MSGFHTIGRRAAIKFTAAALALAALPKAAWAFVVSKFLTRTVERGEFRFDAESGDVVFGGKKREPFALEVGGLVERPVSLSYPELRALPQVSQVSDFHCVEGWSVLDVHWAGVRLKEIADLAKPKPEAGWVIFHSLGQTGEVAPGLTHYRESLPLTDLLDERLNYLLALDLDGAPMPHDRGAPLRLVCPFDLAYKSIKFVTRIEFSNHPEPGWWTEANPIYPIYAPVTESRLRQKPPTRKPY